MSSPGGTTGAISASTSASNGASARKSRTARLRLSLKSLRTPKSLPLLPNSEDRDPSSPRASVEEPRSASADQQTFDHRTSHEQNSNNNEPVVVVRRREKSSNTTNVLSFSTSAPKPSSRFSFIHSPIPSSPSTSSRPSHHRSNTTPTHSPSPSSFGTSPRRGSGVVSPAPQPVKETHTMMKDYDPTTGNKMINKYMIVRELGRGVHGKVKLCRDTETNELCAIKIVDKTTRRRLGRSQLSNEQKIRREIAIMKKCIHPNVVRLIEVIDDPNARKIYMVLEYMEGGEISDFGVSHFSEKNSLERDLENSPIVEKGFNIPDHHVTPSSPIVSVFSSGRNSAPPGGLHDHLSQSRQSSATTQLQQWGDDLELAKTAGSPAFFAPELCYASDYATALTPSAASASQTSFAVTPIPRANSFSSSSTGMAINPTINPTRPPITKAIDVWALGVTLYCFVYGRCPFIADTEFELFNIIPRKQAAFPHEVPGRDFVDSGLKDLLSRLLEKDVFKRITLKEIKEHPWVIEDIPDPVKWRIETDPSNYQRVHVTDDEVKGAVTIIDKIKNRIRKLSVSITNFTLNRRRSKSISSTYTPDSPTTDQMPIPIIRSPASTPSHHHPHHHHSYNSSSGVVVVGANPMSLPERFHHFHHSYNGPGPNFGPGAASRLERPNSVCSNTSSIDEVDEGDEHSGQSGSGSSAQNTTSYVGRRRLFNQAPQQQYHHHHQAHHSQSHQQQQYFQHPNQYQQHHQHSHSQPQQYPHLQAIPMALQARRTYSDDQLHHDHPLYSSGTSLLGTSAERNGASNLRGHSGLSKSWVSTGGGSTITSPSSPGVIEIGSLSLQQQHQQTQPQTWLTQRRPSALVSDVLHEQQDESSTETTPRSAPRTIFPDESLVSVSNGV
ncbi:hypothetical protein BGZ83_006686 [Gryganskiella cystojenkinii]|nr:hypothetical protein BGZ83_006686 [Gryganskiella cystojenkinii]